MSEAEKSVDLSAEAPIDLQGEQAPASIGTRAKRGRPSRIEQHVIWDAEPGDRNPSLCKYCVDHHYPKTRTESVMNHLRECEDVPEAIKRELLIALAASAEAARPSKSQRLNLAASSKQLSSTAQTQGTGPMDRLLWCPYPLQRGTH